MREATAGIVLALLVAAGLTVGYLAVNTGTTAVSSSHTSSTLSSSSSAAIPTTGQLGSWNRTTSYPFPVAAMSCVTSGGFVYCVGGGDETAPRGSGGLNDTYYASLSSSGIGRWTKTTDYPLSILHPTCVANFGYVYCVSGTVGQTSSTSLNLTSDVFYAPLSTSGIGKWTQTTPFPNPISPPPCVVDSSYIYCVTQNATGPFLPAGNTYFAHLSSAGVGRWTESSQIPSNPLGCVANGGYAYCFGGACPPFPAPCTTPSYYVPLSSQGVGRWTQSGNLPTGAQDVYAAGDSYLYFFATPNPLVSRLSSSGFGSWNATTQYPEESPAGCFASGQYLYCIGSDRIDFTPSQNVYFTKIGSVGEPNGAANGVSASTVASDGLKLSTSINATELKAGQRLGVSISLLNTLPEVNSINTSANWPFNGVAVQLWPYCYGVPARIAILQGNYSVQELPAVTNVTFQFVCSGGPAYINSAVFQPMSDQVNLTGTYCAPPGPPAGCANGTDGPYFLSLNFTTSGYYDLGNLSQQAFEPVITQPGRSPVPSISFTPGIYTVAVADEWGQAVVLNFTVKGG